MTEQEKKKMGRPVIGKPKISQFIVRVDEDDASIVENYAKEKGISKTEAVRHGIRKLKEK